MDTRLKNKLFGRRKIFTNVAEVTDTNIEFVLQKAMLEHRKNAMEIRYLKNYHRGKQPILDRIKEVRPEINHKIVENHASEIVSFKTGYVFGSPIMLVQRGKCDYHEQNEELDDNKIAKLNEMYFEESKQSKDMKLGRSMSICGVGHRIILPKPKDEQFGISPFDLINLDSETTFIVYSNDMYERPMLGVRYVKDCYSGVKRGFAYSNKYVWEINGSGTFKIIGKRKNNPIGRVPIIEYRNNDDLMGDFEWVLPLLDALNIGLSDRLNDISQHVQSLLWMNNAEIDKEQYNELREDGVIQTKSSSGNQASIKYLESVLAQGETQTLIDYIYDTARAISGIPDRKISTGGSTGQAIQLSAGWETAESMARSTELQFTESQKEELKIVIQILKHVKLESDIDMSNLALSDVEIKFSRSKNDNALVKGQNLLNMLSAGIEPRIAISTCGMFADAEQTYIDSKEGGYLEKWKEVKETVANNESWNADG